LQPEQQINKKSQARGVDKPIIMLTETRQTFSKFSWKTDHPSIDSTLKKHTGNHNNKASRKAKCAGSNNT